MKKLFAITMIAVISALSLVGCGNVGDAAKEAEELVTDASESISEKASEMMDSTDGDINDETNSNGEVNN